MDQNWYVNNTTVVQNRFIELNGSLYVGGAGNLTLRSVTLVLNTLYANEFGIFVATGGALTVIKSAVRPAHISIPISFLVDGSSLQIDQTNLSGIGSCRISMGQSPPNDGSQGLTIDTPNAVIENSTFYETAIGLVLLSINAVVERDTFDNFCGDGIVVQAATSVHFYTSNDTISSNKFVTTSLQGGSLDYLVLSEGNGNRILNNSLSDSPAILANPNSGTLGLYAGTWNNTISGNDFTVLNGIWLVYGSADNLVERNTIVGGMVLQNAPNNVLAQNRFSFAGSSGYGIAMYNSQNVTIANNTFMTPAQGQAEEPIEMDHSSNASILDNNITGRDFDPLVVDFGSVRDRFEGNQIINLGTNCCSVDTQFGLLMDDVSSTSVTDNTIAGSRAVAIVGGANNTLFANDFTNTVWPSFDSGRDVWDHLDQGNYWSDYGGSGPYFIPPNGTDEFPRSVPAPIVPVVVPPPVFLAPPAPFGGNVTNLLITGRTVYNDMTLDFPAGGVTIETGGELIINDSRLDLGLSSAGFGVTVDSGGSLVIENSSGEWANGGLGSTGNGTITLLNCTLQVGAIGELPFSISPAYGPVTIDHSSIIASQLGNGWAFRTFYTNETLTISHSDLENGTGWQDENDAITASNLFVNDSRFVGSATALAVSGNPYGPSPAVGKITNSTFSDDLKAALVGPVNFAVFSNNTVVGSPRGVGVAANFSILDGNTFKDAWGGLQISDLGYPSSPDLSSATVVGNLIETGFPGEGGITVVGNHPVVERNVFLGTTEDDGLTVQGNDSLISGNTLTGVGIAVGGNDSLAYGNSLTGGVGIDIAGTNGTIAGNILRNVTYAFCLCGGIGYVIYHNNLENYASTVIGSGVGYLWDSNHQGNYWSGYSGIDPNLDGIGDSPYAVGAGMVDSYPYMQPDGWLQQISVTVDTGVSDLGFTIDSHAFTSGAAGTLSLVLASSGTYSLSFPATVPAGQGTRWSFAAWQDGDPNSNRTVQLTNGSAVSVSYRWQNELTLTGSNVTLTGGGWYANGTAVNISATPIPGFVFVRWQIVGSTSSSVANPRAASTTVEIEGPITLRAVAEAVTYVVTFTEAGLPTGTAWWVNVTGQTARSSTSSTISFTETNGTYDFKVSAPGWQPSPGSGSVTVSGAEVSKAIVFAASVATTYAVRFTESGVPSGTNWSVTVLGPVGSLARNSTTSTLVFSEPNGSYSYTESPVGSYFPQLGGSGSFRVDGGSLSFSVRYAYSYSLTFTEAGLPSRLIWSVNVTLTGGGSWLEDAFAGNPITFHLANGTYGYSITVPNGYSVSNATGSGTVHGAAVAVPSVAVTTASSASAASFPWTYLIIGVVVAVLVVGAAIGLTLPARRK